VFRTVPRLAMDGMVQPEMRKECPACRGRDLREGESVEHVIMDCEGWSDARIHSGLDRWIQGTGNGIGLILGGRVNGVMLPDWESLLLINASSRRVMVDSDDEPVWLCLARFLTAVMRERDRMLAPLRGAESGHGKRLHDSVDGDSDDSEVEWHTTGSGGQSGILPCKRVFEKIARRCRLRPIVCECYSH
jgi:hypothetical protein